MTGNTNVWRAPLAGLASLAMLATMGVAAGTASAAGTAVPKDSVKVSFYYEGAGSAYYDQTVVYGDSTVDALSGNVRTPENKGAVVNGKYFIGYYTTDGKPFDFTAPVTADTKVVAKYAAENEVVKVSFDGDYGFYPLGAADGYLLKGSTLAAAQAPTDKADGKLTETWSVTGDGVDDTKITSNTVDSLDKVAVTRPTGSTLASATVKPKTTVSESEVKTLIFNGKSTVDPYKTGSYPLNAYADGVFADDLWVDTTADSFKAPAIVTPGTDKNVYSAWVNTATSKSTKAGSDIADVKDDDIFEIDTASAVAYATVAFDSNGGSDVASQRVLLTEESTAGKYGFASRPADPTRDGYVFKGWALASDAFKDGGNVDPYRDKNQAIDFTLTRIYNVNSSDAPVFKAMWVPTTSELKVTFRDAEYDGRNADVSVKVKGDDFVSESVAPAWTRSGYILSGWQYEGKDFHFDQQVAADVQNGDDFVLTAKWTKVTADIANAALKYIDGDETDTKVSGDSYAADKALFTKASWTEYESSYAKALQEYKKIDFTSPDTGVSAEAAAKIVNELKAAWEKLVFVHKTNADVTGDTTVHRLAKGNDHFYTQNRDELAWLTSTTLTGGSWSDEGRLFEAPQVDKQPENITNLASFLKAAGNDEEVAAQLDAIADPVVKPVYRLYNKVNGDHVWTVDTNEVDYLAAQAAWNDEGVAFYTPAFTGTTDVVRLSKGNRHLLSTDANEQKVLVKDGWGNEGVAFKAY